MTKKFTFYTEAGGVDKTVNDLGKIGDELDKNLKKAADFGDIMRNRYSANSRPTSYNSILSRKFGSGGKDPGDDDPQPSRNYADPSEFKGYAKRTMKPMTAEELHKDFFNYQLPRSNNLMARGENEKALKALENYSRQVIRMRKLLNNQELTTEKEGEAKILRALENSLNLQIKTVKEKLAEESKARSDHQRAVTEDFATGFSMHILQMYAMPMVGAMQRIMSETLQTFGEFEQKFTDYTVKSEEYAERLSKSQFYDITAGQTYSLIEATVAAERFAASGIDVAQSQEALINTLRVATISGVDYNEAANGIIRTMQAMHLEIDETARITDAMVNAANASTAELSDMVGWFEYAASAANNAGMSVEELSAFLGILSSTGLPNTGTAMRQMLLQFSKDSTREAFMGHFNWITEDMFYNMDELVAGLRNYVQTADDQARAAREVTTLLGGKVTAQTALNNLLVAEPELWNQVNTAVQKAGTTQDLYNKVTDNTGHALERLANSWQLLKAQIGEVFKYVVIPIERIVTGAVKVMNALPSPIKTAAGAFVLLSGAALTAAMGIASLVGAMAVMQGTASMLEKKNAEMTLSVEGYRGVLANLSKQVAIYTGLEQKRIAVMSRLTNVTNVQTGAMSKARSGLMGFNAALETFAVASIGFMVTGGLIEKQLFLEAHAISIATSAWIAYNAAKLSGLTGGASAVVGIAAGASYEALMATKIENAKREAEMARTDALYGLGSSSSTTNNNYYVDTIYAEDGDTIDGLVNGV